MLPKVLICSALRWLIRMKKKKEPPRYTKIQDRNAAKSGMYSSSDGNSKLENILQLIEARYVDTVNTEKLYDDAIAKMLEELDPHSVYLPPLEMSHEAEMMDGNFEGIGIEFMIINDTISVVTPISGGPSEQAGIGAGDKIILIDDTVATGKKITNEFVMKKLKGPKDTKVKVTMLKNGTKKLVTYSIKRNKIPIYSVDAGFMLDNEVGYIKVNRFAKNTYREFMEKLDVMQQKNGLKKLILDLRQNPGGFMDQAAFELWGDFNPIKAAVFNTSDKVGEYLVDDFHFCAANAFPLAVIITPSANNLMLPTKEDAKKMTYRPRLLSGVLEAWGAVCMPKKFEKGDNPIKYEVEAKRWLTDNCPDLTKYEKTISNVVKLIVPDNAPFDKLRKSKK